MNGTVAIAMGKDGHLVSAPIDGYETLIAETRLGCSLSMGRAVIYQLQRCPCQIPGESAKGWHLIETAARSGK